MSIDKFTLIPPPRIIFGEGSSSLVGPEVARFGKKAGLVTGKSAMRSTGVLKNILETFKQNKLNLIHYEGVEPDPGLETVDKVNNLFRKEGVEVVVGLGGGSPLDVAKAVAILIKNEGSIREYLEGKEFKREGVPWVGLPTTAGSGAEITPNSVLTNIEKRLKRSVRHPYMVAKLAIIDSLLTLTMPKELTAHTGMDALTHAMEAFTSRYANPATDSLARESISLIILYLPRAYRDGQDREARKAVAMGSMLAAMSFANAMLGACHAVAHPLGAKFGLTHGLANGIMLPYIMEFNLETRLEKFAEIGRMFLKEREKMPPEEEVLAERAVRGIRDLKKELAVPEGLSFLKLKEEDVDEIVRDCQGVGSLKANPRETTPADLKDILTRAREV